MGCPYGCGDRTPITTFQIKIDSKAIFLQGLSLGLILLTACTREVIPFGKEIPNPSQLDTVLGRGKLICGVSGEVPGFTSVDSNGKYSGLEVDLCRAISSALFDDPEKVEYRNLGGKERFKALQTGEVDLLACNATWTLVRDTEMGLEFGPITFYDSQGIMVRKDSKIESIEGMRNATICVQNGTTSQLNLAEQMRKQNIDYKPLLFKDFDSTHLAYEAGRCVGVSGDRSALAARRTILPNPADHELLDVNLSKEPLAAAVKDDDARWFDAVKWMMFATIEAEDLGITSKNLSQQASSNNSEVKRFLGIEGDLGKNMGLPNDFAARIVKHVGNYAEIYDRNLGPNTTLNLPRGLNRLWRNGGLLYSPPFR